MKLRFDDVGARGALAASAMLAAPAQDTSVSGTVTFAAYSGIFQDNYTKAVVEPF